MKKMACAVCNIFNNYEVLYKENFERKSVDEKTFSARRTPDKLHYQLVRCKKCGLIYSNPILEEREIKALYQKSKLTYEKEIENLKKTYGIYLKEKMPKEIGKMLEVGCGNGFFLEEAKRLGFKEVYGIEPSIDAFEKAAPGIKKNIIVDFFREGLFPPNFFDVICFFQTLDHVLAPNEFLKACFIALKKGGYVLCITHNTGAFSAKILGEKSPIFDLEHIYLFDKKSIKKIFEKNGFKVIEIFDVANKVSLSYLVKMFPFPKPIKNVLDKMIKFVKFDKVSVNLKLGNMGIVAKKAYDEKH